MAANQNAIDMKKVQASAERVLGLLSGAVLSGMIYLGDRMGLYQALQESGPVTSSELAQRTGLHERWIREWLQGQAAAGLISYEGEEKFSISPEAAMVLANELSPMFLAGGFCGLPQQMAVLERLPESFKTGLGLPYDAFGLAWRRPHQASGEQQAPAWCGTKEQTTAQCRAPLPIRMRRMANPAPF